MLREPAFALRVQERAVSISDLKAGLWDGTLTTPTLQIHLPSSGAKPSFQTKFTLSGAPLQSVMSAFGETQRQPGVLHLDWQGRGGFELATITGSGSLSLHEAEFLHIPLIGSLYVVFDQLTPGFGRDVASSITANYRLAGGTLHLANLILESKEAHVEAAGSVDLNRQFAHLTAKANLKGMVGLPTVLLSALLELEGEGPVSDVRWKLNNVPGTRVIGGAANIIGKTGGAVIKGAGKAAKGLLKRPPKPPPDK